MPLQPSQVTSRSNSDIGKIERLVEARHLPTPQRMAAIAVIVAEYSAAVEGSTHDPLRSTREKQGS